MLILSLTTLEKLLDAEVARMLGALEAEASDLQRLLDALSTIPNDACVRSAYSFFTIEVWSSTYPDDVGEIRALFKRRKLSMFGLMPYYMATIAPVTLGKREHPLLDLVQGSNRIVEDMVIHYRNNPVFKTLSKVSDHSIGGFLKNFLHIEELIWNFKGAAVEFPSANEGILLIDPPYGATARYTAPGFMRGLIRAFNQRCDIEVTELETPQDPLSIHARW